MLALSGAQSLADRYRVPIISVVVAYMGLVSYFNFHPNHQIRRVHLSETTSTPQKWELSAAFANWLSCRPNLKEYSASEGKSFPIFIAAAEGGGAFAAVHAANVLSTLQEQVPSFVNHVFAISAVSGGALGAASFVSAVLDEQSVVSGERCEGRVATFRSGGVKERVNKFSELDVLSPLIAGALFSEVVQGLSIARLPGLDRAVWFEKGLEDGWAANRKRISVAKNGGNPMEREFFSLWTPQDGVPTLVFNVTSAETGLPFHISPFAVVEAKGDRTIQIGAGQVQFAPFSSVLRHDKFGTGVAIRMSTAVALSARFPYVFPPAAISDDGTKQAAFEFVDGGYYDNTGVNAAAFFRDIVLASKKNVQELVRSRTNMNIDYQVYLITIGSFDISLKKGRSSVFGDLFTPIDSIANTRIFRTFNTRSILRSRQIPQVAFMLNPDGAGFPLGLRLSPATIQEIRERGGSAELCQVDRNVLLARLSNFGYLGIGSRQEVIEHNSCSAKMIGALLGQ